MRLESKLKPAGGTLRPEKIERAKQLIADPNYPPREILQEMAEMLAGTSNPERRVG